MDVFWRDHRKTMGLTQAELAQKSGVSIPWIQLIEKGEGNPSLQILNRIAEVFGIQVTFSQPQADWGALSELGVPILKTTQSQPLLNLNSELLIFHLKRALISEMSEREKHAVYSTLLALSHHYPQHIQKEPTLKNFLNQHSLQLDHGQVIKLRRLALASISKYL